MRFSNILAVVVIGGIALAIPGGCARTRSQPEVKSSGHGDSPRAGNPVARIETSKGTFQIELYAQKAPKHVENFIALANKKFFDGLTFFRVVEGSFIQGGDPSGGGGGTPHTIPAEIIELLHDRGSVAAPRLPDEINPQRASNGNQFYICLAPQPDLDGAYTIFGQVVGEEDMAVVQAIGVGEEIRTVSVTFP